MLLTSKQDTNMAHQEKLIPDISIRRKKILYRAEHRGTKELDFLLGGYARKTIASMGEVELEAFERLLDLPEPQIERMIMVPENHDCGPFCDTISALREFHGLDRLENYDQ